MCVCECMCICVRECVCALVYECDVGVFVSEYGCMYVNVIGTLYNEVIKLFNRYERNSIIYAIGISLSEDLHHLNLWVKLSYMMSSFILSHLISSYSLPNDDS